MLTVRYFAGARAAAGVAEEAVPAEPVQPAAPAGPSLDELTRDLAERHGPRLARVLQVASFLVDGVVWHDRRAPLPAGATIDVLPPFAGG
ncbi:MAG TPA: MoaD/ThiS family protein [Micromonosporaceae bacterium]